MMTPTVHLNGTSRDELVAQFERASNALALALQALMDAAPNARDYYVQNGDAFTKARTEHYARVERVQQVKDEIEQLWESVIK